MLSKCGFRRRTVTKLQVPHHCVTCTNRPSGLCAEVPIQLLDIMERYSQPAVVVEGAVLFEQGDSPKYLYTVTSGCVRLSSDLPDGRRQVLGFQMQGDCFGMSPLQRLDYTAVAVTEASLCRIRVNAIDALTAELPPVAVALRQYQNRALYRARTRMATLGRKTAIERIASLVVEHLHEPYGPTEISNCSPEAHLPMCRADIADYLGLTVSTVSRNLTRLIKSGVIQQLAPGVFRVRAPAALTRLAALEHKASRKNPRNQRNTDELIDQSRPV